MATERLDDDLQGTPTDQMTTSRPDIAFAIFVCARYQARPTVKHLKEVESSHLDAYTTLLDYGYKYNRIPMFCDSKSAIAIS
ncbi:hypothetical protein Tco_0346050 [Tanacetum coccineum]